MFNKLFDKFSNEKKGEENEEQPKEFEQEEESYEEEEVRVNVEFDPVTLHGTHYSVEQFDNEVDRRVKEWMEDEDDDLSEDDIRNIKHNLRRKVYLEWTGADTNQLLQWETVNSQKQTGIASFGYTKEDSQNPLLAPIHGISLKDYTAMIVKISSGVDLTIICKVMGIDNVLWEEVNTLWTKRMQEDTSFTVTTLYGQYFMEANNHPKLANLQPSASSNADSAANLDKLNTDRYYYEELCGARQAAYDYGLDGAQWILDNFGISLIDFQTVATKWMYEQNKNVNVENILHFQNYQSEKQKEYAAKFAAEQGGNIADDVEF